ncbi:hypothetical protein [Streptomyces sp. NRRL B-24572]|uniref:hypothetical protein n=1 Tax=Streptomyces sp. NRRL B-24572 TaxID=1962156 RepID=UPI000A3AD21C|nr:hypothetical protein [Streptomyces sp. NRRL B-24572]
MDDDYPYSDEPRLPLITLSEAHETVALLLHLGDESTDEGRRAVQLASDIALRLPEPKDPASTGS